MPTIDLKELKETEAFCKKLLSDAYEEAAKLESDSSFDADNEYIRLYEEAVRDGESRFAAACIEAERHKQEFLSAKGEEILKITEAGRRKMDVAVKTLVERMCSGHDCSNESFQPFNT